MNVAVALLSALVVLPPMLVWAEERGWVTRGMLAEAPARGRRRLGAQVPGATDVPDVVTPRG
jgi:hypothetical protein